MFEHELDDAEDGFEAEEAIPGRVHSIEEKLEAEARATADFQEAWSRAQELKKADMLRRALIWNQRTVELWKTPAEGAKAFASLASTLRMLRRGEAAVEAAERSIEIDSDPRTNPTGYSASVAALRATKAFIKAVDYADMLLAAHPRDQVARNTARAAYRDLGQITNDPELLAKAGQC